MRVHQITCPRCSTSLKSKAGIPVGQSLSCPKCKKKFTVEEPDDADVIEDADVVDDVDDGGRPAAKRKGPPPPVARRRTAHDEDEEEDEDEDDEPRPKKRRPPEGKKRRRDDDDEEEERPRKKKKRRRDEDEEEQSVYRRLRGSIAVRIITWVVLLTVLAVVSFLYYITKIKDADKDNSSQPVPYHAAVGLDGGSEVR